MSRKSSFHLGDCLCGVLGLKLIQLFSVEALQPWSIWSMILVAVVIAFLWVREDRRET